jgi:nucleoside-diphosphate-sugar epimerase
VRLAIGGSRDELGRVLSTQAREAGHELVTTGALDAYIDVAGQAPNSLLHDGHGWKGYVDGALGRSQRRLQEARARGAGIFVHAGFAFLRGVEQPERVDEPLRSIGHTALAIEEMVLAAPIPACVVRLGYLYGPWMKDLRSYRTAFRLGRPYWSGPASRPQYHLHQSDACSALLAAAAPRRTRAFYATDGNPVAFRQLMDDFARLCGNPLPLHMGGPFKLTARLIIAPEHMQAVKLKVPQDTPGPTPPGWKPRYLDHRRGLAQVIDEWSRK